MTTPRNRRPRTSQGQGEEGPCPKRARHSRKQDVAPFVYVLRFRRLRDGLTCYYVGVTSNLAARLREHQRREGVVRSWGGGHIEACEEPLELRPSGGVFLWEMLETLRRMMAHGSGQVRGWEFSNSQALSARDKDTIRTSITGLHGRCRRCGEPGHFQDSCSATSCAPWLADLGYCVAPSGARDSPRNLQPGAPPPDACFACSCGVSRTWGCAARGNIPVKRRPSLLRGTRALGCRSGMPFWKPFEKALVGSLRSSGN